MGLFDFITNPADWLDNRTAERLTEADLRQLRREQAVLAEQRTLAEAKRAALEADTRLAEARFHARTTVIAAARTAFDAEVDLQFRRHLYTLPAAGAVTTIRDELERERAFLEWEIVRQQRSGKANPAIEAMSVSSPVGSSASAEPRALPPSSSALLSSAAGESPLQIHYADRDIEALALKAVTRFGMLEANRATAAWARWEAEARSRLPSNVAEEVIGRAAELRGVTGR